MCKKQPSGGSCGWLSRRETSSVDKMLDRDESPVHVVGLSGCRPEALPAVALRDRFPLLRRHEVPARRDAELRRGGPAGVALVEQPLEYRLRVRSMQPSSHCSPRAIS